MSDNGLNGDHQPGTPRKRRGLFRRKKNKQNNQEALSFDDMDDSLGMESQGGGEANNRRRSRGRFSLRRGKDDSDTSNRGRPDVITTRPDVITTRPEMITTRNRSRSNDDVSLGSNEPPSPRASPRLSVFRRGKQRKYSSDGAVSDASDRSSLQPVPMQHANSFDSDNMLNHVHPESSLRRRRGRAARSEPPGDPILSGGGFTIHATNDGDGAGTDSEAPIKRISFQDDLAPAMDTDLSGRSDRGVSVDQDPAVNHHLRASLLAPQHQSVTYRGGGGFATDGSFASQQTQTTQTYRSMGNNDSVAERAQYSAREGTRGGRGNRKKYRVRPYQCFNDPVHMTEEEIYNDSTKPSLFCEMLKSYLAPSTKSHKKIPIPEDIREKYGSPMRDGRIGSLRCEVLGCVSLARKSKPDVCVYLIAGDVAFCTDIIQGYRSPMWPSVSRRAAVFPIHHAYTRLYAGVFDVRARKNKENDVFCGRVCIDIAALRPNTEYDITFPLRSSAFIYDKHKRGVIRLRFSLHWFSERAAVLSYFSLPRTLDKSSPLVQGSPTIPCADPKTFRNVAVTVHGSDLPGKYSRTAFKATVREVQLYQLNIRYMLKYLVIDAVMYEKPYISLYLFFAGMHCIITESVSKVPPYFMGFLIIMFLENYKHYVADTIYNEGYQPLTLMEVFKALVSKPGSEERFFEPILVTKRAKRRSNRRNPRTLRRIQADSAGGSTTFDDGENILLDHKEFPFSDRQADPKFSVEHSLAPSTRNAAAGNQRLHGRLSVYYAPTPGTESGGAGDSAEEEEDDDSSDESAGDQTIIEGAGIYDSAFDLDDVDDDDPINQSSHNGNPYGYGDDGDSKKDKIRRIIYTAQNIDDAGGAAVPPQVTVKRVENLFHKNSYSLAVEKVVAPPSREHVQSTLNSSYNAGHEKLAVTTEEIEKEIEKKRKAYLDEFDKLLGLQAKSSNPFSRMFATFLGPLMRILRIPIFIFRIVFSASTWRDPYLSFWVFCAMCMTLLILMAFPWRLFFLLATLLGLGPQNIFLRKFLENRAKQKQLEAMEKEENASAADSAHSSGIGESSKSLGSRRPRSDDTDNISVRSESRRGFLSLGRMLKKKGSEEPTEFIMAQDRPPFSSENGSSASKKLRPRSVVIPYSKLRKERFFDWPPDPTVSRATPLELETWSADQVQEHIPEDVQEELIEDHEAEQPKVFERRLSTGNHNPSVRVKGSIGAALRRRGSL